VFAADGLHKIVGLKVVDDGLLCRSRVGSAGELLGARIKKVGLDYRPLNRRAVLGKFRVQIVRRVFQKFDLFLSVKVDVFHFAAGRGWREKDPILEIDRWLSFYVIRVAWNEAYAVAIPHPTDGWVDRRKMLGARRPFMRHDPGVVPAVVNPTAVITRSVKGIDRGLFPWILFSGRRRCAGIGKIA
jgi:hypothetical protein